MYVLVGVEYMRILGILEHFFDYLHFDRFHLALTEGESFDIFGEHPELVVHHYCEGFFGRKKGESSMQDSSDELQEKDVTVAFEEDGVSVQFVFEEISSEKRALPEEEIPLAMHLVVHEEAIERISLVGEEESLSILHEDVVLGEIALALVDSVSIVDLLDCLVRRHLEGMEFKD